MLFYQEIEPLIQKLTQSSEPQSAPGSLIYLGKKRKKKKICNLLTSINRTFTFKGYKMTASLST